MTTLSFFKLIICQHANNVNTPASTPAIYILGVLARVERYFVQYYSKDAIQHFFK